jgi:hypothetical protein
MHGCSQGFALEEKRFTDLAHGETVFLLTRCVALDTRNMELEVRKLRMCGSFPAAHGKESFRDALSFRPRCTFIHIAAPLWDRALPTIRTSEGWSLGTVVRS